MYASACVYIRTQGEYAKVRRPDVTLRREGINPELGWFEDHFSSAASQILDFLGADGISLQGKRVADVGCGDGIIDLGLVELAAPEALTGFDIQPVNVESLCSIARHAGALEGDLPPSLTFVQSSERSLPADTASFDVVVSWSVFEHVTEPISLLGEMRRVLKPNGIVFIQVWPFFYSANGSHLWDWHADFAHLLEPGKDLGSEATGPPPQERRTGWKEARIHDYRTLNRIDIDELQRCLLAAGLSIRKFELLSETVRIPTELQRYPISRLGVSGVKLLATPTT